MSTFDIGLISFFLFLWIGTILSFNYAYRTMKERLLARSSATHERMQLLWVMTSELCKVIDRTRDHLAQVRGHYDSLSNHVTEVNGRIEFMNRQMAQMRDAPRAVAGRQNAVLEREISPVKLPTAPPVNDVITFADRIVDDISTMSDIWQKRFDAAAHKIELEPGIQRDIGRFRQSIAKSGRELTLSLRAAKSIVCVADPRHVSRCVRAMLAQAIKQSQSGQIVVELKNSDEATASKIEISVTDASTIAAATRVYPTAPDKFRHNPALRDDPAAMLRLNIAEHTARAMNGSMQYIIHKHGNMTFKLSFPSRMR